MPNKPKIQFNKTPAEILHERRARAAEDASQMANVKRQRQPLGGAPPVKVPPLNAQAIDGGGTMEQQADVLQDPTSPLSPAYNPQLAEMQQKGKLGILPPQAKDQPGFIPGVGSMIAGNQPFIGQRNQPAYKPQLSDETRKGIEALAEFQAQAQKVQQEVVQKKEQGKPQPPQEVDEELDPDIEEDRKEIERILASEEFDFLADPKRRERIEASLEPLDVTDIIVHGELRQTIPIISNLAIELRTASGEEDLEVKRMMYGEKGNDLYMAQKYNTLILTTSLVSVNGQELPSHLDKEGNFDKKLFESKVRKVLKFPTQVLADFCVQYMWFDERVRKMLAGQTEALKNS